MENHTKVKCHACGWVSNDGFAMKSEVGGKEVMGCPQCRGVDTVGQACGVEGCWNFIPCPEHGEVK